MSDQVKRKLDSWTKYQIKESLSDIRYRYQSLKKAQAKDAEKAQSANAAQANMALNSSPLGAIGGGALAYKLGITFGLGAFGTFGVAPAIGTVCAFSAVLLAFKAFDKFIAEPLVNNYYEENYRAPMREKAAEVRKENLARRAWREERQQLEAEKTHEKSTTPATKASAVRHPTGRKMAQNRAPSSP